MVSGRTIRSKTKSRRWTSLNQKKTFLFGCPFVDEKMRRMVRGTSFWISEDRGALQLCAIETVEVVEEMLQLYTTTNQKRRSKRAKSRKGSDLVDLFIYLPNKWWWGPRKIMNTSKDGPVPWQLFLPDWILCRKGTHSPHASVVVTMLQFVVALSYWKKDRKWDGDEICMYFPWASRFV